MSKKWVDKKRDKTYKVVFRAHDDPLFHDQDASENVLVEVENPNNRKVKTKTQLEAELGESLNDIRQNEGEAAMYGITFDDSNYDYMQHLKPIGNGDGVFIPKKSGDDKAKKGIEFKDVSLPDDLLPSKKTVKITYQDQQDIPDEISGFKPDMNPALREVLEALEDEAYVEDDDDIFNDLLVSGEQIDEEDFEEEFDEWDLDNYEDEMAAYDNQDFAKEGDMGWEADYRKFRAVSKKKVNDWDSDDEFEDEELDEVDELPDLPSFADAKSTSKKGSKRKQRMKKGAMTDTSSFSMSSSALYRSEAMTILDDKFEKVMNDYENEDAEEEEEYKPLDMGNERADFENMLDDFLDNYEIEGGRRLVKKNEEIDALKRAADSASKGKLAQRRRKQNQGDSLPKSFGNLKI